MPCSKAMLHFYNTGNCLFNNAPTSCASAWHAVIGAATAAGVTEAAIEGGEPVLIERIEEWPGAEGLHDRLRERLPADAARTLHRAVHEALATGRLTQVEYVVPAPDGPEITTSFPGLRAIMEERLEAVGGRL